MSASESRPEDTDQAASLIFNTVARPLRGISLFYTLYYLVEIEGRADAAFDYKQIREEYAAGFYWYGIYSVISEISHVFDRFVVDGFGVSQYITDDVVNVNRDPFGATIEEELNSFMLREPARDLVDPEAFDGLPIEVDEIEDLMETLFLESGDIARARPHSRQRDRAPVEHFLAMADSFFNFVEEPRRTIHMARQLFENSTTQFIQIRDAPEDDLPANLSLAEFRDLDTVQQSRTIGATGWISNQWDGPGWTGVTDHLLRRDELSSTAWVDQSWSVAHNNGNWLDKVNIRDADRRVFVEEMRGIPEGGTAADIPTSDVTIREEAVLPLLDAARDTDLEEMFRWAVHFNDDVGINLRRAKREVGV